jgi:hypothetical protein
MARDAGCDFVPPSLYMMGDGTVGCRCIVCARCEKHTGNANQGHYWKLCSKTKKLETFHFCCPTMDCEYE